MENTLSIISAKNNQVSPIATVKILKVNKRTFELFILICLAMFSFQDVNVESAFLAEKKANDLTIKMSAEARRRFIGEKEKAFALFSLMRNTAKVDLKQARMELYKSVESEFIENVWNNLPKKLYTNSLSEMAGKGIIHHALTEQANSSIPASIQVAMVIVKTNKGKLVYKNDIFDAGDRDFASYKDAFRSNSLKIQDTGLVPMLNANGNDINEWIFTVSETEVECALLKKAIDDYQLELLDF